MKKFLFVVALILICIALLLWWRTGAKSTDTNAMRAAETVPVTTARAVTADIPVWVDGIGTVQPLNTVNIRAQVDGQLLEVNFREGQDVRAGDVLARIDPRSYQATYGKAVAKLAQDQATLANARHDLDRYQKLARTQYTSAQQADSQASTVAQMDAQVQEDKADIASAKVNLDYTTIIAPFAGRVGVRQIDPGNIVHAADTAILTVLTTLKPIDVVFTLPQQMLNDITTVMALGTPEVVALPQNGGAGETLGQGRVVVLDNQVDSSTGTIKLKGEFANQDLRLWPGAFVNVRVKLRTQIHAITIPALAVQRGPDGAFVYVVDQQMKAARRKVALGVGDQDVAVITSGVTPGETVVVDGASRVNDGHYVKIMTP